MTLLYIALYALAIALVSLGLLAPAIICAGAAHATAHRRDVMRALTPIKPISLRATKG